MASSVIGSMIKLISKAEIRYEGQLTEINQNDSTVTLQNVRSFGTEGRRGGINEIQPSEEVYEFIIFRGSDIKDLQVTNLSKPAVPQEDPAIISARKQKKEIKPQESNSFPQQHEDKQVQKSERTAPQKDERSSYASNNNNRGSRNTTRGNRRHLAHPRPHGNNKNDISEKIPLPGNDFDFQNENLKLNKEDIAKEVDQLTSKVENMDIKTFYDKKFSFFDNISYSNAKMTSKEDSKLNYETFGETGNHRSRGRGGFRGGRRGRRGRPFEKTFE